MFYLALCDDCKNDLQEIMECLGALKRKLSYGNYALSYWTGVDSRV